MKLGPKKSGTSDWIKLGVALVASLVLGGSAFAQTGSVVVWGGPAASPSVIPPEASNVVAVSLGVLPNGQDHVAALRSDGTVVGWDAEESGVVPGVSNLIVARAGSVYGAGLMPNGVPVQWPEGAFPPALSVATNLVDVQINASYAAGLRGDGSLVFWGNPTRTLTSVVARAASLSRVAIPIQGQNFILGLRADGEPVVWGARGAWTNTPTFYPDTNAVAITAGERLGVVLLGNGSVIAWGDPAYGLTNPPVIATNIVAVSAGQRHVLALRNDGTVVAWGDGTLSKTDVPSGLSNVVAIAAGGRSSAAVIGDGAPRFVDRMGSVKAGRLENFALNAFAVGAPPLTYRWFCDGNTIPDSDRPCLIVERIPESGAGNYSVVVSNSLGSITGLVANVSVEDRSGVSGKNVVVWPSSQVAFVPETVTNVVEVTGPAATSPEVGYGVRDDGSLVAWGPNAPSGTNAVELAGPGFAGIHHSSRNLIMAWRTNGTLARFSSVNPTAALDLSETTNAVGFADAMGGYPPGYVLGILASDGGPSFGGQWAATNGPPIEFAGLKTVLEGPAPSTFTALRKDGRVVRWRLDTRLSEKSAPDHSGTNIVALAVNGSVVALLTGSGKPLSSLAQSPPTAATNLVDIAAVGENVVALRNDGQVFAWGTLAAVTNVPTDLSRVVSLGAAGNRVLAAFGGGGIRFVHSMGPVVARPGQVFDLNAFAVGDAPLDYKWFKGGVLLDTETSPILRLASVEAEDAGSYSVVVSNRWGMATSEVARLTVEIPTRLVTQPEDRLVLVGDPVSLAVEATGTPAPSFHWFKYGTNAIGTNSPTLEFQSIHQQDEGTYSVVVSNYSGVVTSRVAKLVVRPSTNFNVWTFGYTNYSPFPVPPLALTNVPPEATNIVRLVQDPVHVLAQRTDGSLVAWGTSTITNIPPGLPTFKAIRAGRIFDFGLTPDGTIVGWSADARSQTNIPSAAATTTDIAIDRSGKITAVTPTGEPISWKATGLKNGPVLPEATGLSRVSSVIEGSADTESFDFGIRKDGRAAVWSGASTLGNFESPSTATNLVAVSAGLAWTAFLDGAGGVSTSPRNGFIPRPAGISNIVAISTADIHVLALRNDGAVLAWGKALTRDLSTPLTNVPPHLTNVIAIAAGAQANAVAVGDGSPRFVDEMGSVVARLGDDFYLNAFAVAQPPMTYRWLKDGVAVDNATGPILKLGSVSAGDAGSYSVEVGNSLGSITGVVAVVTVERPASIVTDPMNQSVRAGTSAQFSASAAGDPTPSAQWQFNGTNIVGATDYALSIDHAWPWNAGDYRIVVSNFTGFATSQVAVLTVLPGIVFRAPDRSDVMGPDGFRLRIDGLELNGPVILYGSTNLIDWTPIQTNAPTSGFFEFMDSDAANRPHRFYKVEETATP